MAECAALEINQPLDQRDPTADQKVTKQTCSSKQYISNWDQLTSGGSPLPHMRLSALQLKGTNLDGFSDRITGSKAGNRVDRIASRAYRATIYRR